MTDLIALILLLFASTVLALLMSYIKFKIVKPGFALIFVTGFCWALTFLAAVALVCFLANMILIEWFLKIIVTFFL